MKPWPEGKVVAVTQVVEQHNAGFMAGLADGAGTRMPDDLGKALDMLTGL